MCLKYLKTLASRQNEMESVTLGTGFGGITDIEMRPDGFLYVSTFSRSDDGQGALYGVVSPP